MHPIRRWALSAVVPAVAGLASCATPLPEPIAGYTCCNLRSTQGWISSNNIQGGDLVPAGTPITIETLKRQFYAYARLAGAEFGLRDDTAKTSEDTMRWLKRVVVVENPAAQIASWPGEVRSAIGAARVFVGMTRAQVAVSLGYPSAADTPDLTAAIWRYWTPVEDLPVDLKFDAEGRLASLAGKASAVRTLELQR
ncbi:hypothetical protein [Aquabacterium sp.]|uniref:hypothetical protein n=1 Tax=Aquabacterium sp. TaxID=1872578 RepID=UPI003783806E